MLLAAGYTSAARTTYLQAVSAHPRDPIARINLANLLRRDDQPEQARLHYDAALRLDSACAEAHQGLSYLLDGIDDDASAMHRARGFAGCPLSSSIYRGSLPPIVVLQLVSARGGNIPTRQILDDRVFLTHTLVAEYAAAAPPHDLVLNAIGDADRCAEALDAAERLLAGISTPVLNPPARIRPTGRLQTARRLSGLPGLIVPRIALLPPDAVAGTIGADFTLPVLLRSPGFHTGQHFCRVDDAAALPAAIAALPGSHLMAIQHLDARGSDGHCRKYRVMLVGGRILPLHLAISPDWKVHYFTTGMGTRPAHRAEEARFLADMPAVLGPVAMAALAAIATTLGLDYGGVDFALAADGRLLLFEANATMTIAMPPPDPDADYRRAAIRAVLDAVQAMLRRTACGLSNPACGLSDPAG